MDGPDVSDVADDDGGVGTAPDDPLDALLTSLAENHKETAVFAMAANALLVPVPESLDLHGHRVAAFPIGHSSLDLVIPAYKASAIGAWERVRHGTHSQTVIKMVEDPDRAVLLDLFDARQSHGAYIGVIATAESDEGAPRLATELPDLTPRFARVRKDELAILLETDDSFTKILGWAAEEVVGKRTLDLVHPGTRSWRSPTGWTCWPCRAGPPGAPPPSPPRRIMGVDGGDEPEPPSGPRLWLRGCGDDRHLRGDGHLVGEGAAPGPVGRERPGGPPAGRHRLPGRLHQRPLPLHDRCRTH